MAVFVHGSLFSASPVELEESGPMLLVFGALGNPFLDEGDLLGFNCLVLGSRRHDVVVVALSLRRTSDALASPLTITGLPSSRGSKANCSRSRRMDVSSVCAWKNPVRDMDSSIRKGWLNLIIEGNLVALGGGVQTRSQCKDEQQELKQRHTVFISLKNRLTQLRFQENLQLISYSFVAVSASGIE